MAYHGSTTAMQEYLKRKNHGVISQGSSQTAPSVPFKVTSVIVNKKSAVFTAIIVT